MRFCCFSRIRRKEISRQSLSFQSDFPPLEMHYYYSSIISPTLDLGRKQRNHEENGDGETWNHGRKIIDRWGGIPEQFLRSFSLRPCSWTAVCAKNTAWSKERVGVYDFRTLLNKSERNKLLLKKLCDFGPLFSWIVLRLYTFGKPEQNRKLAGVQGATTAELPMS